MSAPQAGADFSGVADEIRAELEKPLTHRATSVDSAQVRATLLLGLAVEHVAERLDTIIGLVFDEGRSVQVQAETREVG